MPLAWRGCINRARLGAAIRENLYYYILRNKHGGSQLASRRQPASHRLNNAPATLVGALERNADACIERWRRNVTARCLGWSAERSDWSSLGLVQVIRIIAKATQ